MRWATTGREAGPDGAETMVVILMGVSGAGKSTVGRLLADRFDWSFVEGDDHHSPESIEKMAGGGALSDEDRVPWLERLHRIVLEHERAGTSAVITCSALKGAYRDELLEGTADTQVVYLRVEPEVLRERLSHRPGHFFDPALLASQLEALEEPVDAIQLDGSASPQRLVSEIEARLF